MMGIRIITVITLVWLSAIISYATTRTYIETDTHREYARLGDMQEAPHLAAPPLAPRPDLRASR